MQRQKIVEIAAKGLWTLMSLSLVLCVVQGARLGAFPALALVLAAAVAAGLIAGIGWLVFRPDRDTRFSHRTRRYMAPCIAAAVIAAVCLIGFHVETVAQKTGAAVFASTKAAGTAVAKPFALAITTRQDGGNAAVFAFAAVNPETKKIEVVSVPVAALVPAENGAAPINTLSTSAAVSAMENVFGLQAGHRIRLSTAGMKTTIDDLGGIRVTSGEAFTSGPYTFTVGTNVLSGSEALAFGSRSSENALLVLDALVRKMASEQALTHYTTVMAGLSRTFKTDFSAKQFAELMKTASGWQMSTYALSGTAAQGGVQLDQSSAAAAKSRLQHVLNGR